MKDSILNEIYYGDFEPIEQFAYSLDEYKKMVNERANNLAKGLLSIGVGKGDHVGIWAKNVPEWLTFMFATAKIGACLLYTSRCV